MAKISGLESRPCCTANQPNSVKPDGEFISLKLSSQLSGQHHRCIWMCCDCQICNLLIIYSRSDVFVTYDLILTGMSGWTPASRKPNGHVRKRRNFSTWPSWCPLSGGQSPPSSDEQLLSVWSITSICCTYSLMHRVITFTSELFLLPPLNKT